MTTSSAKLTTEHSLSPISPLIIGEDRTILVRVSDKDGVIDLSGSTLYFTLKDELEEMKSLISKDSTDVTEIEIQNQVTNKGEAKLFILFSDTAKLPPDIYVMDMWIVLSSGDRRQIVPVQRIQLIRAVTVL